MKIDVVDMRADNAPKEFVDNLRRTGFGVLSHHPIPAESVKNIYEEWLTFFNGQDKEKFLFDEANHDGFFPSRKAEAAKGSMIRDLKEYYHFYKWGRCPDKLKVITEEYFAKATELSETLLSWVQEHSPEAISKKLSEPLSNMTKGSKQNLLRVLHYPPLSGEEPKGAIRASAHEDINLLTLLPAANAPGLQLKRKDGSWYDVPCDFGHLIVNIGDMLQEATDGYFPSTTHRVINPEGGAVNTSRVSLPLFLHPRADVVLSEKYTAGAYLKERLDELKEATS